MPLPTRAGVLGMARTMRPVPSHCAMLSVVMPAATLRCRAWAVWGAAAAAASLKVWGLTAQTTRSWPASAALAAGRASMPNLAFSASRAASKGSTTVIWLAGRPLAIRPPMMALAMLPPPMKAMRVEGVWLINKAFRRCEEIRAECAVWSIVSVCFLFEIKRESARSALFLCVAADQAAVVWRTARSQRAISSSARDLSMVGTKRRSAFHSEDSSCVLW